MMPRDQTKLINTIFKEFRDKFSHFFDPCEDGFTNEVIISLATSRLARSSAERSKVLCNAGTHVENLMFIMQGVFALTNKVKINPTTYHRPFMLLARNSIFGDYQILFDLYINFDFRTYVTIPAEEALIEGLVQQKIVQEEDIEEVGEYVTMVLEADKLKELCELYPETESNLKWRSLDRRNYYLTYMD